MHTAFGAAWVARPAAMFTSAIGAPGLSERRDSHVVRDGPRGVLPAAFAEVHPQRKTPTAADDRAVRPVLVLGLGLGSGSARPKFFLLLGFTLVTRVIFVYIVGDIGWSLLLARGQQRVELDLPLDLPDRYEPVLIYSSTSPSTRSGEPYNWSPFIRPDGSSPASAPALVQVSR